MTKSFTISRAVKDDEILATFAVMKQLRPSLRKSSYISRLRMLEEKVGFQLVALRHEGKVLSVAGFRLCYNLGWGKYLYVDDLVTDKDHRSTGAGKRLFHWLVQYAEQEGCDELRLDSAVYRNEAHRFYLRERMDIACFNFRLAIKTQ